MTLPPTLEEPVLRALASLGLGGRISGVRHVGGGCINNGSRLETDAGATLFLKWHVNAPADMFEAEADGLTALERPGFVRVPTPLAWSDASRADGPSWLLLEFVPSGSHSGGSDERLGVGLARVHASADSLSFGWHRDNWIGSLPQANAELQSWGRFWRDRRLAPQLEAARSRGRLRQAVFDRVLELTPEALSDVETPRLVHGDLWGGNWFADPDGEPVLIDPAVHHGDGEVDLAMSELFGGFGPGFYEAYRSVHPESEAYSTYRRDLYQLYYLLVHVNLFGGSYEGRALHAARKVAECAAG